MFSVELPNNYGKPIEWPWPTDAGYADAYAAGRAAGWDERGKADVAVCNEVANYENKRGRKAGTVGAETCALRIAALPQPPAAGGASGAGA